MPKGRGSWYSSWQGKYRWHDSGDNSKPALGVPEKDQGIALPSRKTLGKWFWVTAPNGVKLKLRQTDLGPAKRTKRLIDIAAPAAEAFGYSPHDFPTNGEFTWEPVDA